MIEQYPSHLNSNTMFVVVICCLYLLSYRTVVNAQTVTTALGTFNGVSETVQYGCNPIVNKFLGIPFAEPPVGHLRLQKPVPLTSLSSDPWDATSYGPPCIQTFPNAHTDAIESEDCLYLNIFQPAAAPDKTEGHAVMVWIYGGSFTSGAANIYDATFFAGVGNVIVVTFNYRVGFFGFYSNGDSTAPGNYGLYDQAVVFQWVHDNIGYFGGDNSRVTVFGHSAGSISASIQSFYPANFNLFQKVIMQSGAASTPYIDYSRDVKQRADLVAGVLTCQSEDKTAEIACIKQYPAVHIKTVLNLIDQSMPNFQSTYFIPIADGDMVLSDYSDIRDENLNFFRSLDLLSGHNSYDGNEALTRVIVSDVDNYEPSREQLYTFINLLSTFNPSLPWGEEIQRVIYHEYTDFTQHDSFESVRLMILQLLTDYLYAAPAASMLQLHDSGSTTASTYAYEFSPVTSVRPYWTPSWLPGADHSEEVRLVFGLFYQFMPEWEKTLSYQMITYWSNFAQTGNPNTDSIVDLNWPEYDVATQDYMILDDPNSQGMLYSENALDFWTQVIPGLQGHTQRKNSKRGRGRRGGFKRRRRQ